MTELRIRCTDGACRVVDHGHREETIAGMQERHRLQRLAAAAGYLLRRGSRAAALVASRKRSEELFMIDAQFDLLALRVQRPDVWRTFGEAALTASMYQAPGSCGWCVLTAAEVTSTPWDAGRYLLGRPCDGCAGRLASGMLGGR